MKKVNFKWEDEMFSEKKVVAVAGASSGIGRAIVLRLADRGYPVSFCARRFELIEEMESIIRRKGGEALGMRADMTDWEQAKSFVERTIDKFGRIDVMINNVGAGIKYADFDDLTIEEIDEGIKVNLMSVLYGCRAVIPYMKKQKGGYIINTSSILGKRSRSRLAIYTAGKHGVEGFSRSLYNEVKKYGIKVSILGPAMINTEWAAKTGIKLPFSKGRMLEPEDIATIVEFLISTPEHYTVWSIDLMALDQTIDPL
ncbi:MAG: oxidoreductase [Spirochaetes bacterium]|nr:MAG: oxidoreductase [Spirochaetota bacterium]